MPNENGKKNGKHPGAGNHAKKKCAGPSKYGKFEKFDKGILKKCVLAGFTNTQIAGLLGVTEHTFDNWKRKYPDAFLSLKDWKIQADKIVEKSLYQRAKGYSKNSVKMFCHNGRIVKQEYVETFPPDPTSMIFWLKNRQPDKWRDRREFFGTVGVTLQEIFDDVYEPAERSGEQTQTAE
jgi:hypothetical protein